MTILQGIILGIVQGLTEFLPVSSSGHLVLLQRLFSIDEGTLFFTTMVHVGTLVAVVVIFKDDIWDMLKKPFQKLSIYIVIATLPTIVIALLLKDFVEAAFNTGSSLGIGFIITGTLLWLVESKKPGQKILKDMKGKHAIIMGIAQGAAIFPGVSRAGSTITGGLFQGLDRRFAAKFSFLMSIPAILGSLVFQFKDLTQVESLGALGPVILGSVAAGISGYFAIKLMMDLIAKKSLKIFSIYVYILGAFVLVDQFILHKFL
jgi:undecaprenyl-diphosphatase